MNRKCVLCKKTKPPQDFYIHKPLNKPPYFYGRCKKCEYLYHKNDKADYYEENKEYFKEEGKKYNRKRKLAVLFAYGEVCACCGEKRVEFLAIDHIDGGGSKERRETGMTGASFYMYLVNNGFPPGYRVLCHNCNMCLGFYGYCVHDR